MKLIKRLIRMSIVAWTRVTHIPTAEKHRHAQTRGLVNEDMVGSVQNSIVDKLRDTSIVDKFRETLFLEVLEGGVDE